MSNARRPGMEESATRSHALAPGRGCSDAIRKALASGGMTFPVLCELLSANYSKDQVRRALTQLCSITGGVVSSGGRIHKVYRLARDVPAPHERAEALPTSMRYEFRPLERDIFEHRDLAMMTRR